MWLKVKENIAPILVMAFVGALLLRIFVFEAFVVRGDSMNPAIVSGDYVFVNKLAYKFHEPERGDIIVTVPRTRDIRIIKRIVGLPGERFEIKDGKVLVRGSRTAEAVEIDEAYLSGVGATTTGKVAVRLDPGEYFILGDNRGSSVDSRELGLIDEWDIKGRVSILFRIKSIKLIFF